MGVPDTEKLELIPLAKSLVKLGLTYVLKESMIDHGSIAGLADDDHTQYLKEKASGGLAAETPTHTHQDAANAGKLDHGLALDGLGDDDHTLYILASGGRAFTGDQSLGGQKITNLAAPAAGTDAVNKTYADGIGGFPATTKIFCKQAACPTAWTIDDTIQDLSMVMYARSGSYAADGGSQDPTSMATPSQALTNYQLGSSSNAGRIATIGGILHVQIGGGATLTCCNDAINSVNLTPRYTHAIVCTKD